MKENKEEGDNRKPTERLNLIKTVKEDKTGNLIANRPRLKLNLKNNDEIYEINKINLYKSQKVKIIKGINDKEHKKIDISKIIEEIKEYDNCLNFYLENIFSNRNLIKDFWDLNNCNDRIELFYDDSKNEINIYCKWCKNNCNNNLKFKTFEKEILFLFLKKDYKICNCKKYHKEENPTIKQKINEFNDLKNDSEKMKYISNLFLIEDIISYSDINDFKNKNKNILNNFIFFSPVTNQKYEIITNYIELNFKYDNEIFKSIFSNFNHLIKLNSNIDSIYNFCEFYFKKYLLKHLKTNEISLLDLIEENLEKI